mgnify:CR=1 FL=1
MPDEVPEDTERFEAEAEEISGETEEEEFHFVRAEDENPFADDSEEETDEGFGMESEEEELERARKVMCNFGLFSGKTLGEMMENPKGADTVRWMATGYYRQQHGNGKCMQRLLWHMKNRTDLQHKRICGSGDERSHSFFRRDYVRTSIYHKRSGVVTVHTVP